MQEQITSSRWATAPFTWASKAANATVNATASVFKNGPVLTATFVATQITTAAGGFCFSVPNQDAPYYLSCADSGQLANLSKLLESGANATAAPLFQCAETTYEYAREYGTTYFGNVACLLSWHDSTLNPLVNSILNNNVVNGIFGGSGDGSTVLLIGVFGVIGLAGITAGIASYFYFGTKCCDKKRTTVDEDTRLVGGTQDQEDALPRSGPATVCEP